MQNVVVNVCEKFHNDRLRNDRSLGNGKYDSNKNKNNVRFVALGDPSPGLIKNPQSCNLTSLGK